MAQNDVGIYASQISGHLWAPQGTYDAIATITVPAAGAASIEFTGIPQGYKHLQLRITDIFSSGGYSTLLYFNGDTAANYSWHAVYTTATTTVAAANAVSTNAINLEGWWQGHSNVYPYATIADIFDYSSVTKNKTIKVLGGFDNNSANTEVAISSGAWYNSSTAISSLKLVPTGSNNFAQYSQFSLYGIK